MRVRACGLNRLDLWMEEAGLPIPIQLPRTPARDRRRGFGNGCGRDAWKPGDQVAIQSNLFCGECEFCRAGDESLCLNSIMLGVHAMAVSRSRSLCRLAHSFACRLARIARLPPR